jgi:hypothetical protein
MDSPIRSRWPRTIIPKSPGAATAATGFLRKPVPVYEGYTLELTKEIKAANPGTVVAFVGGLAMIGAMKNALKSADLVSPG